MIRKLRAISLFIVLLAVTNTAYAITPISGTITQDTVWTAAGGPYTVVGNIKVAPGVTLTIEGGAEVNPVEVKFLSNLLKSHATHFDNTGKGPGITDCNVCHNAKFKDDRPLETTTVCNACHSPDGAFPGALGLMDPTIGAKANFASGGIYEIDGITLKPGKEKWCSSCHDAQQSISNPVDGATATYAPNIIGDNTTYGFWATGHGKSINNCLECHDASKKHLDHEHRTYEVDETNNNSAVNGWGDSYRLRASASKPNEHICVKCHDQNVLQDAGGQSDFKNLKSGHTHHIWGDHMQVVINSDTDYDGVADSRPACTTCHNVHGSKSAKMVRTGELSSTPGTDDRTPGLNHTYAKPATGPFSTATWVPNFPSAGTFGVYVWWRYQSNLEPLAKYTINHDGGSSVVTISQRQDGSRWVPLGSYNFQAGTGSSVVLGADNTKGVSLIADKIGFDTDGDSIPDIIVDDADPEFSSIDLMNSAAEWPYSSWYDGRALTNEERFDFNTTLAESTAGYVRFNPDGGHNISLELNNVCNACHGAITYERTPFLGAKVINRFEEKRWVLNDGTGVTDIVVSVPDPDGDMAVGSVSIDLSSLGGSSSVAMTNDGNGTFSYQLAIPAGTFDKAYALPVTATDGAGHIGTGTSYVFVKDSNDSIYLDNVNAAQNFADVWDKPDTNTNAYAGSYITTYNYAGTVADPTQLTATWETTVKTAGSYKVYAWLYSSIAFNSNATYTVVDSNGSTSVSLNQEGVATTGSWELIGTFNYEAGAKASITVGAASLGITERLYVDAVKLELVP